MGERVLLVDDDPHLLSALRRQLGDDFDIETATSGQEAIEAVRSAGAAGNPFAVVVSDMRMPGLDGIETLAKIREIAPETVRMMLTGNADQQTAIQAINRGNIFRFFNKPCPAVELFTGITDGIAQFRLVMGEGNLLRTIQRTSRALKTLSAANSALGRADNLTDLLTEICKAAVEEGGYRMAWVGIPEDDESRSVKPVAYYGAEGRSYLDSAEFSWADRESGCGPVGRAIRLVATQIALDIQTDPTMTPWREAAQRCGYASVIALPISGSGRPFGVLTIYSREICGFVPEEIGLLEEMAGDMAFGVTSQGIRMERDRSLQENRRYLVQLQSNLEETIKAFASTIEMRDPYTAGHQRRVAALAKAIAQELEMAEDKVEGLYFAALIHDLGKINIPSEFLCKPGRLSEIEFMLIKVHPQAAYDILKGINFPWPIAKIVLQHHERLNGSGYPNGLKGDEILLEARILAVADVLEAMVSHRPYRAGLGIEAALTEITTGREMFYDPRVADACLRLFREKGHELER